MKTNLRKKNTEIKYRFADLKEAQTLYLSNTEYFKNLTPFELEYKLNKKNATLEEYKTFGVSQMLEFTDNEKELMSKQIIDMENTLKNQNLNLPFFEEIMFIKSTQNE